MFFYTISEDVIFLFFLWGNRDFLATYVLPRFRMENPKYNMKKTNSRKLHNEIRWKSIIFWQKFVFPSLYRVWPVKLPVAQCVDCVLFTRGHRQLRGFNKQNKVENRFENLFGSTNLKHYRLYLDYVHWIFLWSDWLTSSG